MDNLTNTQNETININNCPVKGWSFGAMMFGFIWGIGNKSYLTFIGLIPIINIFWWIVCGICGHKWAWVSACKNGTYQNVNEFEAVQKSWDRAGFAYFIVIVIFIVLFSILCIVASTQTYLDSSLYT